MSSRPSSHLSSLHTRANTTARHETLPSYSLATHSPNTNRFGTSMYPAPKLQTRSFGFGPDLCACTSAQYAPLAGPMARHASRRVAPLADRSPELNTVGSHRRAAKTTDPFTGAAFAQNPNPGGFRSCEEHRYVNQSAF